jgi:transposase
MRKYTQGRPLTPEEKYCVVTLKQYFDRNKNIFTTDASSVQMAADALGLGLATVMRIMASYNKDPESLYALPQPKGRPAYAVDTSQQQAVRTFVRQANLEGQHITLESVRDLLQQAQTDDACHITTLAKTLDRWGFEFGKGVRTQHLKEKDHVIAARQRYLRKIRRNRSGTDNTVRPVVYLDETYVNKNHSNDFTWYFGEDGPWIQKPTGNGERLIILNAITRDGWVPNVKTTFNSLRKTGDYHGQMNAEIFQKWWQEKLLPNIPKSSLIVLDNASYHNTLSIHSAPTPTCSKQRIREWLESNKMPCNPDSLKAELAESLEKLGPEPLYEIDDMAREAGHEVIRTPPYHPELQPIEICWGVVKNEVARNCKFTMRELEVQLEQAWKKVTVETCRKIIKQVRAIEDKFWEEDAKLEQWDENSVSGAKNELD